LTQKSRRNKPKSRPSLRMKWKLLLGLFLLVFFAISLLWILETVLLDEVYQFIKTGRVKNHASVLAENIDGESFEELIQYTSQEEDMCISVYKITGKSASEIYTAHEFSVCLLHTAVSSDFLNRMYLGASEREFYTEKIASYEAPADRFPEGVHNRIPDSLICAHLTEVDGVPYLLILNTEIQPVTATVDTLQILLIGITVVLLLAALAVAFCLSRILTLPVSKMNEEAKKLATGNYDVHFSGRGLRETEELGTTLNYAARELSKVDRMQKELMANISHDLRTPLTMISGYSEVMRDIPGEMTAENMQIIIDETHRLTTLVNDTLDLSRLTSGRQILNLSAFSLTEVVRDAIDRYSRLQEKEGYAITFLAEEDARVYADETKILQVVYNLLNNAIRYTGADKRITVSQTIRENVCRISITDSGEGIPEEQLPMIWERYYKLSEYHRRGAAGSGLGLSIVKNILLLHGARFGVSSEVGLGSTFWFELKTARSEQNPPAAADPS